MNVIMFVAGPSNRSPLDVIYFMALPTFVPLTRRCHDQSSLVHPTWEKKRPNNDSTDHNVYTPGARRGQGVFLFSRYIPKWATRHGQPRGQVKLSGVRLDLWHRHSDRVSSWGPQRLTIGASHWSEPRWDPRVSCVEFL